ncbi:MAG: hypothetical protein PHO14_02230 [Kiritimatiellae bacterium]|nr:hypothetical protein [Kiritimatiellia bacterium]MDD4341034.1 hypothetical protein [Kiritimatiellia bacterium]
MNRLHGIRMLVVGCLCWGSFAQGQFYPDGFPVQAGSGFQALDSANPDRPEWLFTTARGVVRSEDQSREWAVYEFVLDRRVPFHHVLIELALTGQPDELFVRLLDGHRRAIAVDLFGNIAERATAPGNVVLDIPLAENPEAEIVQILIPLEQEAALNQMAITPASYEILMRTGEDFVSGAKAWIRTPIYDSKNLGLLSDLVLLEEGRLGDLSSPVSSFRAYGVEARTLDALRSATASATDAVAALDASFSLDAMPLLARFDVALRQFDPLNPLDLWLNGQRLGPLSLDLPDLEDAAYGTPANWRVGRWTRAWFYISPEALRMGDNQLSLRPADQPTTSAGIEVRDAGLQFKYPWEEIGTYSFVESRHSTRHEPVAGDTSPAPADTTRQEQDTVVLRVDSGQFQPIGPHSDKPDWLISVAREYPIPESKQRQYRIRLNPDNRPAQLGIDIVALSGAHAPVSVSLLQGDRLVAKNLLQVNLNSGYVQMTTQLLVPLQEHPEADTVVLFIGSFWHQSRSPREYTPSISRLQLKAAWPAAVLASGQLGTEGSLMEMQYDSRSAFVPAEVLMPASDGSSVRVQQMPPAIEGEWYGVETRVLQEKNVSHGDFRSHYFTDWHVDLAEQPVLGRVDFLAMHLSVVDGMEVFVNGERAGAVSLHLPGVQDANYMIFHVNRVAADGQSLTHEERYAVDYGAQARASLVFDGRLLHPGRNIITLGRTPRLKGTNDHYTFKNIRLQLKYSRAIPSSD